MTTSTSLIALTNKSSHSSTNSRPQNLYPFRHHLTIWRLLDWEADWDLRHYIPPPTNGQESLCCHVLKRKASAHALIRMWKGAQHAQIEWGKEYVNTLSTICLALLPDYFRMGFRLHNWRWYILQKSKLELFCSMSFDKLFFSRLRNFLLNWA